MPSHAAVPPPSPCMHAVCCRRSFYFWEGVSMVQTLGLVAAEVFGRTLDTYRQALLQIIVLVTNLAINTGGVG